jgi:outer membrane protein OmpA-like peptidoglycan-associated protein
MKTLHALLLGTTALFALSAMLPAKAATSERALVIAQQNENENNKPEQHKPPKNQPAQQQKQERSKPPQTKQAAPAQEHEKKPVNPAAQNKPPEKKEPPKEVTAPKQEQSKPPQSKQAAPAREDEKKPVNPAAQNKPPENKEPPKEVTAPKQEQSKPPQSKQAAPAREEQKKPANPATQNKPPEKNEPPKEVTAPKQEQTKPPQNKQAAPTSDEQKKTVNPAADDQKKTVNPAAPNKALPDNSQKTAAPVTQPVKPHDASEFIRRGDSKVPQRDMTQIKQERRETREGNRTLIHEGDRTIVREGNHHFIRHDEDQRFAIGARDVNVSRRGEETVTVIVRPNGVQIVNVTDRDGRLLRRLRRDSAGHEIVIIDNRHAGPRDDMFVELPPPRIGIPRDRYIVEADRADPDVIYGVLTAAPVMAIEHRYTLDQVRYSYPLRERMPRIDLDINFDTGSWQLNPEQIQRLAAIARGLKRAIEANPREVFLVEGHTDAVGSDTDNLSLSDRRAEAVAVALTEEFGVPAENLVTQGYGEQHLKEQTEGASQVNRRVTVRRVTPLIDQAQNQ